MSSSFSDSNSNSDSGVCSVLLTSSLEDSEPTVFTVEVVVLVVLKLIVDELRLFGLVFCLTNISTLTYN